MVMQIDLTPVMEDLTPFLITFAAFVLAFVITNFFDMGDEHWTIYLFVFGIVAIGVNVFGYSNSTLMFAGIVALGIAVYVKFIRPAMRSGRVDGGGEV